MLISGCGGVKVRLVMVMISWGYGGGKGEVGVIDAIKPVWGRVLGWFVGRGNLNRINN